MNHKITMHPPRPSAPRPAGAALAKRLFMLSMAVWTVAGTGCFRATGIQRTPMAAEVLPEYGGDAVLGLKAKGGAGDLYLGNDFIQVTIDSTVYGDPDRTPLAGAQSGGSIIDAGYIILDGSYNRVSVPGNVMNRLTPVVNQDAAMEVVFDQYATDNNANISSITMTGRLLDPNDTLGTHASPVANVAVTHSLAISQLDHFFTVSTTVTNNTGATLPIFSIGDFLTQQGGGYAFNIPAAYDYQGNALPAGSPWGVRIPATCDFSNPIRTGVRAPMVGLMNTEPGADTVDSHCSLGILPADADQLLVTADPQNLLMVANTLRPQFPQRLVAGSLPAASGLAPGASLTYNRRLFMVGGTSVATSVIGGLTIAVSFPGQATGLFNLMDSYRYGDVTLRPVQDCGILTFTLSGMSQRQGPLPTEVRIERNLTATTPPVPPGAEAWQVQRVEFFTPNENIVSQTALAPSTLQVRLPVGIYRMVLTDQNQVQTRTVFTNLNSVASTSGDNQWNLAGPIWIQKDQNFLVSGDDILCPEAANDAGNNADRVGPITSNPHSTHYFTTREANSPYGNLQPLRMTFVGTGATADPVMPRMRTLGSSWDVANRVPQVAGGIIPGQNQFRGGNEMFGTGFTRLPATQFAWFPNNGSFRVYGQRGPLSDLVSQDFTTFDGQSDTSHVLTVLPWGLPPGWTSFDLPGPGQATTGGFMPLEKIASAMANGVQVVGHTEQDLGVDASLIYWYYRAEYSTLALSVYQLPASLSAMNRPPDMQAGWDPFVVSGRTSTLANYGTAAALFTPLPSNARLGGALPSTGWTLADFLAQAQGQFNVVLRPRGPAGLFTQQGAPTGPGAPAWNSALNAWWGPWSQQSGPLSFGMTNGRFDALELLRGESLDPANPTAWFSEFLQVRSDWFGLLNYQSPAFFTKALALSSANFSIDTPVGLARTYLKASPVTENDLSGVLAALQSGAAVASTGPFLDVSIGTAGPGGLVPGPLEGVTLVVNLWKTDWMPVDELRVIVNGTQVGPSISAASLVQQSGVDPRLYTGSFPLTQAQLQTVAGRDAWVVVEAGVPLATSGIYAAGTPWNLTMRGIYPIAVTNPIFVNVTGGSYKPPMP